MTVCVHAQDRTQLKRVGVIASDRVRNATTEALRDGLREHGWIEGENIALEIRYYEGRIERIPEIAADLTRLRTDVFVVSGLPATLALKQAVPVTPIVVASVTDPVATGVVSPAGNVAAFNVLPSDSAAAQLAILRDLNPTLRRVALLWNQSNPAAVLNAQRVREAAAVINLQIIPIGVTGPSQVEAALASVRGRGGEAIFVVPDPQFYGARNLIGQVTTATTLPTIAQETDFADFGVLIAYGANVVDMWRQSASYADRILKGARPADLPVGTPARFELVINVRAARSIGLTIPQSLLMRADRLVDR